MSLHEDIDTFVREHLPSNPKQWCMQYGGVKIVHDALWGTLRIRPHEAALIDTLLIQRLRYLHQTGAVYLTYPSARHTRFEHTLGVLYQSGRLCEALLTAEKKGRADRINPSFVNNVRFAALLHDTGHGPFSHTSEQFYGASVEIEAFRRDNPLFMDSGAGEILSYLISQSAPFQEFVSIVNESFGVDLEIVKIGKLITGTTDARHLYQSEVIHGPFDADKLDYMARDALFSGLKLNIDIDRLYHSVRIISAEFEGEVQTRIAGHLSGLAPFTQVMFNKMLLFTGIYHHHKVRAADCMLWAVFNLAKERGQAICGRPLKSPVDFLYLTDDKLLTAELVDDHGEDISDIIRDLRARRLWKRALVIARNTIPAAMHSNADRNDPSALYNGIMELAGNEQGKLSQRRQIAMEIWERAGKPCKVHEVWLDVPRPPTMTEAKKMWIFMSGQDHAPATLEQYVPVDKWVELYGAHQSRAHVFAPAPVCSRIADAAEQVFKERFQLSFLPEARLFAKSDVSRPRTGGSDD